MATNRLGAGTVTLSVNITEAERLLLGRLACERDMSTGALLKRAWLAGLKESNPQTAAEIQTARERHRAAKAGICLSVALLAVALQFSGDDSQTMRRASQTRAPRREEVAA